MQYFVQQFINGVSLGSVYALLALGVTLVWGVLDVLNFAQAQFMTWGAFGVAFGIGRDLGVEGAWLLAAVAAAVVALLMRWLAHSEGWVETVAIGLVIGGALGNVVDRLRQGAVTDWLDLHYAGWHWPIFNLADVAIVSGVTLLLFAPLLQRRSAQNPGTSRGSV